MTGSEKLIGLLALICGSAFGIVFGASIGAGFAVLDKAVGASGVINAVVSFAAVGGLVWFLIKRPWKKKAENYHA